jgi:ABC-type sugar transport system permease subunit
MSSPDDKTVGNGRFGTRRAIFTNVLPLVLAIYPLYQYGGYLQVAYWSVGFGLLATLVVAYSNLRVFRQARDEGTFHAAQEMQPMFDKCCWSLMAVVLLVNSVDEMNRAFYANQGINVLTSEDYQLPHVGNFTALDVFSVACGLALIGSMSVIPWLTPPGSGTEARKAYRVQLKRWVGALSVVVVLASLLVLYLLSRYPAMYFPDIPMPTKVDDWSAGCALVGVLVFIVSYLGKQRAFFDLGYHGKEPADEHDGPLDEAPAAGPRLKPGGVAVPAAAPRQDTDTTVISQRYLRRLKFEAVFMPPLVASVALVGGALNSGKAVVFGFFIYGGFGLWSLAIKVIRDSQKGLKAGAFGLATLAFQFFYALMMTVLWTVLLVKLESFVGSMDAFKVALNVILSAIFIQLVFGPVYRSVWARALSDEWIQASPEYFIVATAVCAGLAALHQEWYKPWLVGVAVLICIAAPMATLRRSLTAYVLIRVRPGFTERVRAKLFAADLNSSVLFGDYDVLVKVEVPGNISIFPKKGKGPQSSKNDVRELIELGALVHREIRCLRGEILETQTLLDFSDYVDAPDEGEPQA